MSERGGGEKNPTKLMSMLAKMTTLLLFTFPLCVWSKVMILNFISCGLILEVQDNIRCLKTVAFHIFSCLTEDILHTFKSVYVVQLYPV